jgi:hypothetical protein
MGNRVLVINAPAAGARRAPISAGVARRNFILHSTVFLHWRNHGWDKGGMGNRVPSFQRTCCGRAQSAAQRRVSHHENSGVGGKEGFLIKPGPHWHS